MEAFKESSSIAVMNAASLLVMSLTVEKPGHIRQSTDSTGWRHGGATHTNIANATNARRFAPARRIIVASVTAAMLAGSHRALTENAKRKDHAQTGILMITCLSGSVSSISRTRRKM